MLPVTILGIVKAMRVWRIWDSTFSSFFNDIFDWVQNSVNWEKRGPFVFFHPQVPFVLNSPYEESQYFSRIKNFTKIDYKYLEDCRYISFDWRLSQPLRHL